MRLTFILLFLALSGATFGQLSKQSAAMLTRKSVEDARNAYRAQAQVNWKNRAIPADTLSMKFHVQSFGQPVQGKRSLYISLHGGGGTTAKMNDGQWENQKKLYTIPEGLYFVPRAPTNTWNLWHEAHIDDMLDQVIKSAIALEQVDPDRVYLLGYSAGGDGLYQLAPRMADRLAAASMMAGHPGDASPLPLRNLPFAIFMGGNDSAYNRNKLAAVWGSKLDSLAQTDAGAYVHQTQIYDGLGHWMNRRDTTAISWMAGFKRKALPLKVVWVQDDRIHEHFYWLATARGKSKAGDKAVVRIDRASNSVHVDENSFSALRIRLNDELVDLDKPVTLVVKGKKPVKKKYQRSAALIRQTAAERLDEKHVFSVEINVP